MDFRAKIIKCECCGEVLRVTGSAKSAVGYVAECEYCGHENILPRACIEEDVYLELEAGKRALSGGRFDEAKSAFEEVVRRDGEEPEGYFWLALAKNKVTYVRDYKYDELRPVCYAPLKATFSEDKNFKKALALAEDGQKELYKKRGEQIDYIISRFNDYKRQKIDFDCFICVKVSEITDDGGKEKETSHGVNSLFNRNYRKYICDGNRTADCEYVGRADGLYNYLTRRGHKVFFSEVNCRSRAGEDYEAFILYALTVARCMVIVCSDESYLDTPWVKNEYSRYYNFMQRNEKAADSMTIVYNGAAVQSVRVNDEYRPVQGIDGGSPQAFPLIEDFIKKFNPEEIAEEVKEEVAATETNSLGFGEDFEYAGENLDELPKKTQKVYLKAEKGNKRAQYVIGVYYEYGKCGMSRDHKKAAYWYYQSAKSGCAPAQYKLGQCYANGQGVDLDEEKAFYWYEKSSARDFDGLYETAFCYENGIGVQEDIRKAVKLYEKAARRRGHKKSCYRLKYLYENGIGVPKSSQLAKKWEKCKDRESEILLGLWIASLLMMSVTGTYVGTFPTYNLFAWHSVGTVFWLIFAVLGGVLGVAIIGFLIICIIVFRRTKESFWADILVTLFSLAACLPFVLGMSYYGGNEFHYGASNGIYYDLNDDGTLTAFTDSGYNKKEIRIPEEFNGKTVTRIEVYWENKNSVEKVYIANGFVSINEWAFMSCTAEIVWGDNPQITAIGQYAFADYKGEKLTIPDTVTEIGSGAFWGCTAEIVWGDSPQITTVGQQAFSHYSGSRLSIPDCVTVIESIAFIDITAKDVILPAGITEIGGSAFSFNTNTSVEHVYYKGSRADWDKIKLGYLGDGTAENIGLADDVVYCYSETEPQEEGRFWRFVDGEPEPWL